MGKIIGDVMRDKNVLTVEDIIEDDFGCEGIPDDSEAYVTVVAVDCDGIEQRIRMSDSLAYERKLKNGSKVTLQTDGTLKCTDE